MAKKKKKDKNPKVHEELDGLNVNIDPFGEVKVNLNIDDINKFLDDNVEDKKLTKKQLGKKKKKGDDEE